MKRRHFIRVATACLMLPAAASWVAGTFAYGSRARRYAFFDERFPAALHLLGSSPDSTVRVIPVQSDVTALWKSGLDRMTRDHVLRLRGVTTQSFLFCLRVLAAEQAHVEEQASRLDRYLFTWTLHTTPRTASLERRHG